MPYGGGSYGLASKGGSMLYGGGSFPYCGGSWRPGLPSLGIGIRRIELDAHRCQTCLCKMSVQRALYL